MNTLLIIGIAVLLLTFSVIAVCFKKISAITEKISEDHDHIKKLENKVESLKDVIKHIRLDNLISFNNELAKYREGIYEDEYFIQEVGDCKIFKIIDKMNGETTHVSYDDFARTSATKTYKDDILKYSMEYTEGILSEGTEYRDDGQISYTYEYDMAGEIKSKIEYHYDGNGTYQNKQEIVY
jgi:restriction endonuclease S subunit